MQHQGEALITIPCWWDGSERRYYDKYRELKAYMAYSLVATIHAQCPDVIAVGTGFARPISLNPPPNFFRCKCPQIIFVLIHCFSVGSSRRRRIDATIFAQSRHKL